MGYLVDPPPVTVEDIREVAQLYRRLILLVGAQLIVIFGAATVGAAIARPDLMKLSANVINLVLALGLIVTAFKLLDGMDSDGKMMFAIGMFLPLLNIIVLLMISKKATAWCRKQGVAVGFFGPTKRSLGKLDGGPGAAV